MPGPQPARRPELGHLLQQVVVGIEEEAQTARKGIHGQACPEDGIHVGLGVGKGERNLLGRRAAGLPDVIAADGNRVEARHFALTPPNQVRGQAQGRSRRENVGAARHVLLENVVLDRPGQAGEGKVPIQGNRRQHGQQNRRRRIDGHAETDPVQRDVPQQNIHVPATNKLTHQTCRLRPPPIHCRRRSPSAWAGRRQWTGPTAPVPSGPGSADCCPRPCRNRHIGAWSTGVPGTCPGECRG